MGVCGQRHAPAALYLRERTHGTYCTGGWADPRAGLDTEDRGALFHVAYCIILRVVRIKVLTAARLR
jgi:hypothetical protein